MKMRCINVNKSEDTHHNILKRPRVHQSTHIFSYILSSSIYIYIKNQFSQTCTIVHE